MKYTILGSFIIVVAMFHETSAGTFLHTSAIRNNAMFELSHEAQKKQAPPVHVSSVKFDTDIDVRKELIELMKLQMRFENECRRLRSLSEIPSLSDTSEGSIEQTAIKIVTSHMEKKIS